MSSTNRGYDRHKSDYYITPQHDVKEFLDLWIQDIDLNAKKLKWLDPCAGGDKDNEMSYPAVISREFLINIDTNDIRKDSRADTKIDFLNSYKIFNNYDVVITNPPFDKAIEIIEKSLEAVKKDGYVVMLLRLNFFGSKGRRPFFETNMPTHCYVHHKRMSFTSNGSTDSIEYAHFVWQKGISPEFTKLKII